MITLRHHVLTIVAVFLALAAGIVLGGGPLSDVGPGVVATGTATDESAAPVEAQAGAAYNDAALSALAPTLVSGRLAERSVALVTVPGADEQDVTALTDAISAAGGTVSARYSLGDDLVDPGQKSLVDTLGSQLLTQQGGDAVAADASTYDRIGQLIGLAVATKEVEGQDATGRSRAVLDAVTGAGLMEQPADPGRRAPLVLLVLGTDAADEGADAVLAGIAEGLAAQATGVVVAGTVADGGPGQLGRLRADPAAAVVASVDGIDTSAGRVAAILALQRSLTTPGGAFGASGADGTVPLG
ncbi:Copper transport outer membrane protein, MctB [Nocardioides alpinus]|uniref:Copper transport outer membrane protein, MctB n=1 Tax=Nocardioides alpinus TaxID=748909 RepID=A0A1I1BJD5_9ACTN|nr:copper transporter [Nocardioides alpinus]SFB48888.1 Copper transport outer membrane protein, MctB [Nocardioides alpinus]